MARHTTLREDDGLYRTLYKQGGLRILERDVFNSTSVHHKCLSLLNPRDSWVERVDIVFGQNQSNTNEVLGAIPPYFSV